MATIHDTDTCSNCGHSAIEHIRLFINERGRLKEEQGDRRYGSCRMCDYFLLGTCNIFVPSSEAIVKVE